VSFCFSGDVCDSDIDGDGVNNDIDNCVYFSNPTQTDSVEETRVPRENHRPVASHWQTLSHNDVLSTPRYEWDSNSQL
jgi:hypothetical protein